LPKHAIGFIYVLSNEAMPGIVKVGITEKLAEDRAKKLHGTGVPLAFDVEFRAATSRIKTVETKARHTGHIAGRGESGVLPCDSGRGNRCC